MGLFVWRSSVPTGYSRGVIIVEACSVEKAREKISSDIDRWLRLGEDEGSPCWYDFDKDGKPWDEYWDEMDKERYDSLKSQILSDISEDPLPVPETEVLWIEGGG